MGFQLGCEKLGAMARPGGAGQYRHAHPVHAGCPLDGILQHRLHGPAHGRRDPSARQSPIKSASARSSTVPNAARGRCAARSPNSSAGAELFDITGLTELYGPGTGIECPDHDCIHYWGDYYLLEIIDPETLKPMPDGEWGEMVVTTLSKEAAPLIRYRTRDITRIIPESCTCGSVMPRHSRIMGPQRRHHQIPGRQHLPFGHRHHLVGHPPAWVPNTRFT